MLLQMMPMASETTAVLRSEFLNPKTPSCHAPTISEAENGLVAAYFAGRYEGHGDVGIWITCHDGMEWSNPKEVANGLTPDGKQYPCWNPVLFQAPAGPLFLFYKVGPNCAHWWGMMMRSDDGGQTWSEPERLPDDVWGPIKNKPVLLADGTLVCPSSTEHDGWRVHIEHTADFGRTWHKTDALNDRKRFAAIQPALLCYPSGRMQILCRSKQGVITACWSEDKGQTWDAMHATSLPNPNSGIDAVMLRDGRALLVYNHSTMRRWQWGGSRTPLNIAVSNDGVTWTSVLDLENGRGEYSYPAVIQAEDNFVHVVYTWRRERLRHVVIDPDDLEPHRS